MQTSFRLIVAQCSSPLPVCAVRRFEEKERKLEAAEVSCHVGTEDTNIIVHCRKVFIFFRSADKEEMNNVLIEEEQSSWFVGRSELTSEQRSGVGAAMEAESRSATNTLVYLKICLVSDLLRNKACETLTL